MKEVTDIRLENLRSLIKPEIRGNIVDFARKHQLDPVQLSTLHNERRSIGEKLARKLEKSIGLPPGSLDVRGMEIGSSPAQDIEDAINRAGFMSAAEKKSFIGMVHAIKDRKG